MFPRINDPNVPFIRDSLRLIFPRINGPIGAKQVKKQCFAFYHPRLNLS